MFIKKNLNDWKSEVIIRLAIPSDFKQLSMDLL